MYEIMSHWWQWSIELHIYIYTHGLCPYWEIVQPWWFQCTDAIMALVLRGLTCGVASTWRHDYVICHLPYMGITARPTLCYAFQASDAEFDAPLLPLTAHKLLVLHILTNGLNFNDAYYSWTLKFAVESLRQTNNM